MYTKPKFEKSKFDINTAKEGETLEQKLDRMLNNGEALGKGDNAPMIYQERKDGLQPQFDIRTDKFELAAEYGNIMAEATGKQRRSTKKEDKNEGKAQSTDGKPVPGTQQS